MIRLLYILILITLPALMWTQEVCDNGIDDDGDSLVDYDDPDCMCCANLGDELIQNADFADHTCCDALVCYDFWNGHGATEIFNPACTFGYPGSVSYVPQPIPGGGGFVGMQTGNITQPEGSFQCFSDCLGSNGSFTCSFSFFSWDLHFDQLPPGGYNIINVYGIVDCNDYEYSDWFCPISADADLLHTVFLPVGAYSGWTYESFSFTPLRPYTGIFLISDCDVPSPTTGGITNHVSNLSIIANSGGVSADEIPIVTRQNCNDYILELINIPSGATLQWYLNGVPQQGENGSIFYVPIGFFGQVTYGLFLENDCDFSDPIDIVPVPLIEVDSVIYNPICAGDLDGSIELFPSNGQAPYDFIWEDGTTNSSISNLPADKYTVTITDDFGCTIEKCYEVKDPSILEAEIIDIQQINSMTGFGSATVSVISGDPFFYFEWDSGEFGSTASMLTVGLHEVIVKDGNGCIIILTVEIIDSQIEVVSTSSFSCVSECSGTIAILPTGPNPPFNITWSDTSLTGFNLVNLCFGTYSYILSDQNGAEVIDSIKIDTFRSINFEEEIVNPTCIDTLGGEIDITNIIGDGPFLINWSTLDTITFIDSLPKGIYNVTISDIHNCQKSTEITLVNELQELVAITPNKCAGDSLAQINIDIDSIQNYSIIWSDGNTSFDRDSLSAERLMYTIIENNSGCQKSDSLVIIDPPTIEFNFSVNDSICRNTTIGNATIDTSGFQSFGFQHFWHDGSSGIGIDNLDTGAYEITVIDKLGCELIQQFTIQHYDSIKYDVLVIDAGCNGEDSGSISITTNEDYNYVWENGQLTPHISDLIEGEYTIKIMDLLGCEALDTFKVNAESLVVYEVTTIDEQCFGDQNGTISIIPNTGNFSNFLWSNDDTTSIIQNLESGLYNVTLTDQNGCIKIDSFIINSGIQIIYSTNVGFDECNSGGTGIINITSDSTYNFEWSHTNLNTSYLSGLPSMYYFVEVETENGCKQIDSFFVEEGRPILYTPEVDSIYCKDSLGSINLHLDGNINNYQIVWSNNTNEEQIVGLTPNSYEVLIIDDRNCEVRDTFLINEGYSLELQKIYSDTICDNTSDGFISYTENDVTFLWNDGFVGKDRDMLLPNEYTIIATHNPTGCKAYDTIQIVGLASPNYEIISRDVLCYNQSNGTLEVNTNGSVVTAGIFVDSIGFTNNSSLSSGLHELYIIDKNGCVFDTSFLIKNPPELIATTSIDQLSCIATSDGSIALSISGGNPTYSITWDDGSVDSVLSNLSNGVYSATITDENGCKVLLKDSIYFEDPLEFEMEITDIMCDNINSGVIIINILNGLEHSFSINNNQTENTNVFENLAEGNYLIAYHYSDDCLEYLEDVLISKVGNDFDVTILDVDPNLIPGATEDILIDLINPTVIENIIVAANGDVICESNISSSCLNITHFFEASNEIVVTAIDSFGCQKTDTLFVELSSPASIINVPNIFSPNGDDKNDNWSVSIPNNFDLLMADVYDRWGNKIFSSSDKNFIWDGTFNGENIQPGVYVYHITLSSKSNNKIHRLTGDITVLR